jgi:hypothetical protein
MQVVTGDNAAKGERTKMTTENAATINKTAEVGAQSANVAPEKAPSKKIARSKKAALRGHTGAKVGKPKPVRAAKPKKSTTAKTASKASKSAKLIGGSRA